jgi:phosphoribosylformylglycinamidine synthase
VSSEVSTLVLSGFGINCEAETCLAFERAGASTMCVHLNDLIEHPERLKDHQILAIPGGFSFGDDVASGKIFANRLRFKLGGALLEFVNAGKLVIGICNGFQVMVKMGILPLFENEFKQEVTLTHNNSDRFENRWVKLKINSDSPCIWLKDMDSLEVPIRHGEGKFIPQSDAVLERLKSANQVAVQYASRDGILANGMFPENPNGSIDDIAGICDPSGRIFGLMPHPEAFLDATNHPRWTREMLTGEGAGLKMFRNAVAFVKAANL